MLIDLVKAFHEVADHLHKIQSRTELPTMRRPIWEPPLR
jgi:hypothetical protein